MHYSKRFIAFGGIVAIAFLIKYNIPGAEYEQIGSNLESADCIKCE